MQNETSSLNNDTPSLIQMGWQPFFQQQLSLEEFTELSIGRIIEHHRSSIIMLSEQGQHELIVSPTAEKICVGDWVLFDSEFRLVRLLDRQSIFQRKSPGTKVSTQLIAANVDTLMIVCSLNQDFNLNRIERYLAIAKEAQVEPVVILTKADQCDDVASMCQQAQTLDPLLMVYALNALDNDALAPLESYCKQGKTVAFIGSSGVGKSTLVNGLLGYQALATGGIREDDSKG